MTSAVAVARPVSPARVKAVLLKAADIIEQGGWLQGAMTCEEGKHCAAGAIAEACGNLFTARQVRAAAKSSLSLSLVKKPKHPLYRRACAVMAANIGRAFASDPSRDVIYWNDRLARRQTTVVSKLRKAAQSIP